MTSVMGGCQDPAHEVSGLLVVEIPEMHVLELVIGLGAEISHKMPCRLMSHVVA